MNLIEAIEKRLGVKVVSQSTPPQGMGSTVIFITADNGSTYAVKQSSDDNNDATVLKLLLDNHVDIALPKFVDSFVIDGKSIVITEKINSPLLEAIKPADMGAYIPSMIKNLKALHKISSPNAGFLNSARKYSTWKEFLLSFFNNDNPALNWEEIVLRPGLDSKLISKSLGELKRIIESCNFDIDKFSLLHSDFNQRNLFVDLHTHTIAAVIDWGEAMYGDPIYDFARIRMLIWHFNLGNKVEKEYYELMQYTHEEQKRDTLYWICRVVEYLAYYSEELNEFNFGRIKLHQEFLKSLNWDGIKF